MPLYVSSGWKLCSRAPARPSTTEFKVPSRRKARSFLRATFAWAPSRRAPCCSIVFCSPMSTTYTVIVIVVFRFLFSFYVKAMPKHKSAKKNSPLRHSRVKKASRRHSSRENSRDLARRKTHRRESSRDSFSSRDSSVRRSRSRDRYGEILRDFRDFLAHRISPHNLDVCQVKSPVEVISSREASSASSLAATRPCATEQNITHRIEHTVAQADRGVVPGMSSCWPSSSSHLAKGGHNRCDSYSVSSSFNSYADYL